MRVSDAFPSKYLRAADLQGQAVKVLIDNVHYEDIGDDHDKPVMMFQGKKKGLVLNKTNALTVEVQFGDEMDDWVGKEIEIYPTTTSFQGKIVDCLRIRIPVPPAAEGEEEAPF